ncbi:MAG: FAD-dependent oxidoreductase [Nitrospinae bacterium]|nr:FAD-dependent oxidoreductase [Nitrospinota bacterium]
MGKGNTCGIAGAGIMGRLTGYLLAKKGWRVTLFDDGDLAATGSTSYAAAGMIAPYCELEYAEPVVARLGNPSLAMWQKLLPQIGGDVYCQAAGSLVISHPQDRAELMRLVRKMDEHTGDLVMQRVEGAELRELEPDLDDAFMDGLYLPLEGQIDSRRLLVVLGEWLQKYATLNLGVHVRSADDGRIETDIGAFEFDMVLDTRGLKGKTQLPGLRGVRGELVWVHAPEVRLNRPVRMMHPRYPIYVVPRPGGQFILGATAIDDEDLSPISVRGTLELLSAAYAMHSGFSEGRVIETMTQCRPAFSNNLPRIRHGGRLIRVNGLYRHGYLFSPKIAELVISLIEGGTPDAAFAELYEGHL